MSDTAILNYKGNRIDARAMEGQLWLKAGQIVQPLGFASVDSVLKIVQRYPEEFGPEESRIIPLPTPSSGLQPTRAFSLRGVRLLCLLARTEPARAFRRWILDLLEGRVQLPDASERRAEVENAPLSTDARRVLESIAAWPEADSALVEKIRLALSSGGGLQRAPKLETAARRFLAFAAAQRVHMKEFGAIRATAARDGYSMEAVKAEARRIRAMENGQGTLSLPHA